MCGMRRADDQELRRVLSEALDAVPVPRMPWTSISSRVHPRSGAGRSGRWWVSSAAVVVLLLAVAFASRSTGFTQAARLIRSESIAPQPNCAVTFSISGPTVLQPRGHVAVTSSLGHPIFLARGSGSGYEGPCGTMLRLTQHPANAEDVLLGWVVSKRPGEFQTVRGRPSTIQLTLRGSDEVVYVKYTVRGSESGTDSATQTSGIH